MAVAERVKEKTSKKKVKIALAGNPNSGKSTLFNALTGLNQKVSNYPGVTVDKKTGSFKSKNNETFFEVIDLPGSYSLASRSEDEKVASEILSDPDNPDHPDTIVCVADASNLKRNLFFCSQLIDLKKPITLVLNMIDIAEQRNIDIDIQKLSEQLGIQVVAINARKNLGIDKLKDALESATIGKRNFIDPKDYPNKSKEIIARYQKIAEIIETCVQEGTPEQNSFTHKLDKVLTHKVWGFLIFIGILLLVFQAIFKWSEYPMELIETFFVLLGDWSSQLLPEGVLRNLLVDGIIAGLGGVLVFIPQIAILFFFIAILEDTGYMARVSLIMDKLLRKFGLNGRSVIPLISGVACAIPAIMGARTISNWKERLITIMVTPLMSCSARLPVYTLLIALVIPGKTIWGVFNLQALTLLGLYLIGFLAAILSAYVMKFIFKTNEKSHFIMEMPVYKAPRWDNILLTMWEKVKVFVIDAGKVIVAISIILWVLSSYAPGNKMEEIEQKYAARVEQNQLTAQEASTKASTEKLEASYAGIIGKGIEPAIEPLGFNWKIGIALITSFAAREVFVGTMATIYSIGDEENTKSIREKMMAETNPQTNEKVYSVATGISLMVFYAFAMQCMSTLAIVFRETKHWKWPVIQLLFMSGLAYFSSLIIYQLLS